MTGLRAGEGRWSECHSSDDAMSLRSAPIIENGCGDGSGSLPGWEMNGDGWTVDGDIEANGRGTNGGSTGVGVRGGGAGNAAKHFGQYHCRRCSGPLHPHPFFLACVRAGPSTPHAAHTALLIR